MSECPKCGHSTESFLFLQDRIKYRRRYCLKCDWSVKIMESKLSWFRRIWNRLKK